LRLDGEGLDLLGGIPREKRLLRRLQDVGVLRREVAACCGELTCAEDGEAEDRAEKEPETRLHGEGSRMWHDPPRRESVTIGGWTQSSESRVRPRGGASCRNRHGGETGRSSSYSELSSASP